jgi:hypothetical protein
MEVEMAEEVYVPEGWTPEMVERIRAKAPEAEFRAWQERVKTVQKRRGVVRRAGKKGREQIEIKRKGAPEKHPWAPPGWTEEMVEKLKKKMGERRFREWKERAIGVYVGKLKEYEKLIRKAERTGQLTSEELAKARKLERELRDVEFYKVAEREVKRPIKPERIITAGRDLSYIHRMAEKGMTEEQAKVYKRIMKEQYGVEVEFKPSKKQKVTVIEPVITFPFPKDYIEPMEEKAGRKMAGELFTVEYGRRAEAWYPEKLPFGRYMPKQVKEVVRGLISFPVATGGKVLQTFAPFEAAVREKKPPWEALEPSEKRYIALRVKELEEMKWESLVWGAGTAKVTEMLTEMRRLGVSRYLKSRKLGREYIRTEPQLFEIDSRKPFGALEVVDGKKPQLTLETPRRPTIDFGISKKQRQIRIRPSRPMTLEEPKAVRPELTKITKPKAIAEVEKMLKRYRITRTRAVEKAIQKQKVFPIVYPISKQRIYETPKVSPRVYERMFERVRVSAYERLARKAVTKPYERLSEKAIQRELKRFGIREWAGEVTKLGISERLKVSERQVLRQKLVARQRWRPRMRIRTQLIRPKPVTNPRFSRKRGISFDFGIKSRRIRTKPAVPLPTYLDIQLTELFLGKEATAIVSPKIMMKYWKEFEETAGMAGIPTAEMIEFKFKKWW